MPDFFKYLPNEIILKIFSENTRQEQAILTRVDKQFLRLANDSTLELSKYKMLRLHKQLIDATYKNDLVQIKKLVSKCSDINLVKDSDGSTLLHIAAKNNFFDIAVILIASKAKLNSIDKNGDTPLHHAAAFGYAKIAKLFIDSNANPQSCNKQNKTPVDYANSLLANAINFNKEWDLAIKIENENRLRREYENFVFQ